MKFSNDVEKNEIETLHFFTSMGRVVQDYPSHGNWKNAMVHLGKIQNI